ncbi:MAG: hypothetical protein GY870_06900 [archaeon]|nr:hypothetical protein [archaeon]
MHEGAKTTYNIEAWSEIDKVGKNGVYVRAVKAFLKKKHAIEWIKRNDCNHLIIRSATIN